MTQPLPDGWPTVTEEVLRHATMRATAAFADEAQVVHRFRRYYDPNGNYAGATFLDLNPNPPASIEPSDLLAVATLSVTVHPLAIRRLTGHGPEGNEIRKLLASDELDPSIDLLTASRDTLAAMERLYLAVKAALAPAGTRTSNAWVTASKICARKRPELFPVRDRLVQWWLGTDKLASYATDWQVFRELRDNAGLMQSVDLVLDQLQGAGGGASEVVLDDPMYRLRHLDVGLWMHAVDASPGRADLAPEDGGIETDTGTDYRDE